MKKIYILSMVLCLINTTLKTYASADNEIVGRVERGAFCGSFATFVTPFAVTTAVLSPLILLMFASNESADKFVNNLSEENKLELIAVRDEALKAFSSEEIEISEGLQKSFETVELNLPAEAKEKFIQQTSIQKSQTIYAISLMLSAS